MDVITTITATEDVALVTLRRSPADIRFIAHVFSEIAKRGVNVDMISQTTPVEDRINLSFTVPDSRLDAILDVCAALRKETPELKTDISSGNCKLSLSGDAMRSLPGVASKVFDTLADSGADIRIITTSEVDISILITKAEYETVRDRLESAYSLKTQVTQSV